MAVQVNILGEGYLYREAGFPGLAGAARYITPATSLREVVDTFVREGRQITVMPGDEYFMDGFDQTVTARLSQLGRDVADGWRRHRGFLQTK